MALSHPPRRVGALLLGLGLFAVLLSWDPSLPEPIAYGLVSAPLALCWYGLTSRSPASVAWQVGLIAVALTLVSWVRDAGVL